LRTARLWKEEAAANVPRDGETIVSKLPITFACGDYDRVRPLRDGRVRVEGCDLADFTLEPEELFHRVAFHGEFDVAEMSFSTYMMAAARGPWHYVALPVYISRMFRHACIYVNANAGIRRPEDLKGRRVGVPEYQMTAALAARGLLQDEYGVTPADIRWVRGGLKDPGRPEFIPFDPPKGVHIDVTTRKGLAEMLVDGEIDALITARVEPHYERGDPRVARLFPTPREAERAYYAKTKIHPIMHVAVVKRALAEQHPWLPASLYKAFDAAKNLVLDHIDGFGGVVVATAPWLNHEIEEARRLFGRDFWPYGVAAARTTLDAMTRWSHEQGLSPRRLTPADLFAPTTLEQPKI
jgi:4,5-dihydroxyphthalate decarboxylase